MIAKIAVSAAPFAIDKPYSYRIPQGMMPVAGIRVTVPFGRGNRKTEGIVLEVSEGSEEGLKTIDITEKERKAMIGKYATIFNIENTEAKNRIDNLYHL